MSDGLVVAPAPGGFAAALSEASFLNEQLQLLSAIGDCRCRFRI